MAGRLAGKVALITGGGSGQGRTAAMMFSQEGAKIALSDVQEEGGTQTQHMVTENGGEALFVPADVSSEGSAKHMVEAALRPAGYPVQQRRHCRQGPGHGCGESGC